MANSTEFIPIYDLPAANRRVVLARRPEGSPGPDNFVFDSTPMPEPRAGQFLVRNLYLSADPVQRGWASNPRLSPLGQPMRALAVGVVVASRDATVPDGDIVYGVFGWQDYTVATGSDLLCQVGTPRLAISNYAGALGMPGVTAWLAFHDLAPPSSGQTVLVSTAAGTVGSVVGQIARRAGARVIGLTGSDEKITRCTSSFGYAAAYNYRKIDLPAVLADAAPSGFDTYFDNTGGNILDMAIRAMARHGRIIHCGTAATPSWSPPPTGLRNEREILMRALTCSGFVVFDHVARFGEAVERLTDFALSGDLVFDEDIDNGIEAAPAALAALFAGSNSGKKLIWIGQS
jgi:hypothetical protein